MKVSLFWFRRDLRLNDNAGLYHALKSGYPVVPVFIFDLNILEELDDKEDRRVVFIHQQLDRINKELQEYGSCLQVYHDTPANAFKQATKDYDVDCVYTNRDYEPYATARDKEIQAFLKAKQIGFKTYKDQVIFERSEVVKDNKEPYTVFTPYSKKWKSLLTDFYLKSYPALKYKAHFCKKKQQHLPSLKALGFIDTGRPNILVQIDEELIKDYDKTRDIPSVKGTTHLGVHLRFGTVSIRKLASMAQVLNETFLNELIWREFFMMILAYFPKVINNSFREEYDHIKWRNNDAEFNLWCEGKTGYPIVDAGMRELNETGFMHNRVRMITASFLCKHLLIDWRWGEAYFAKKLLDYDLSANNGNWQWAAGTGCDAAPYFRVFSPKRQTERFDPQLKYIKQWVPELETSKYPQPVVDHDEARQRCLQVYKQALRK